MVKAQLVRLDDSLKQIERRQVAGIQRAPGSLPVLEAFQTFLENEQRKARRRMLAITAFALVLLCTATGGGYLLVRQQLQKAQADFRTVDSRTDSIAQTVDALKRSQDADIQALEDRFREESNQIVAQYSSLQQEQQATLETLRNNNLAPLEERLVILESQNAELMAQLEALQTKREPAPGVQTANGAVPGQTDVPQETAGQAASDERPAIADAVGVGPRGSVTNDAVAATSVGSPVEQIDHPLFHQLTIVPEGHTSGIRWLLPKPLTRE